jgi:hypothetical protein
MQNLYREKDFLGRRGTFVPEMCSGTERETSMKNFCDIIPHWNGWTYVLDGVEAECSFHTYELAFEAAKSQLARESRLSVFRRLGLNGDLLPVLPTVFPQAPARG